MADKAKVLKFVMVCLICLAIFGALGLLIELVV